MHKQINIVLQNITKQVLLALDNIFRDYASVFIQTTFDYSNQTFDNKKWFGCRYKVWYYSPAKAEQYF